MAALAVLVRLIESVTRQVGRAAAWLMPATVLLCATVALGRYLLGFGRVWLQELYIVCFAVSFMLVAAHAYGADQHIRIEILHARWSARTRAWIEILGCLVLLVPWLVLVAWTSWPFVRLSWLVREPSAQPGGLPGLFLVKTVLPLFAGLMLLQAVAIIGRNILLLTGNAGLLPPAERSPGAAAE